MIRNRSVPADVLLPHLVYENVAEAGAWLTRVFGFAEHFRYGDPSNPQGMQMHLGEAWIMLRTAREGSASPKQSGQWTQSLTVFVEDVDGHYTRTKAAGAAIDEELHETEYGGSGNTERSIWADTTGCLRHNMRAMWQAAEAWGATVAS